MNQPHLVHILGEDRFCHHGYARAIPFGCVDRGLLSVLYFLPGQAMAPHRHLDSDEYFTAICGDARMLVDGALLALPAGHTFLRVRGMLHAISNPGPSRLVVQSFQAPIPQESATRWEDDEGWPRPRFGCCPRCWCGQQEAGSCVNCGAGYAER